MRERRIDPFLSVIASLDPRAIGEHYAQDALNGVMEDGAFATRPGYRNLAPRGANFDQAFGLEYLQGYDADRDFVEEFVSIERNLVTGVTTPFSIDASTFAKTQIKDGTVQVELDESDWLGFPYDDRAYFINPNETNSIKRHTIGDPTSWDDVGAPTAPPNALTLAVVYGDPTNPNAFYDEEDYSNVTPATHVTPGGLATNTGSTVVAGQLYQRFDAGTGEASIEIDFDTANSDPFDWEHNDILQFSVVAPSVQRMGMPFELTIENSDGDVLGASEIDFTMMADNFWNIRAEFRNKDRTKFEEIAKVKFRFQITFGAGSAGNRELRFSAITIGGVWLLREGHGERRPPENLLFAHTFYNSAKDEESNLSPLLEVSWEVAQGYNPGWMAGLKPLGTHLELTAADIPGQAGIDKRRWYYNGIEEDDWHRVDETPLSGSPLTYKITDIEARAFAKYQPQQFKIDECVGAFPMYRHVVWLYKGGSDNVRHSRVSDPEKQFNQHDPLDDLNRGENFTMAENFADEPLAGFQAGPAAIYLGTNGVYAQQGFRSYNSTYIRPVPTALGCAGRFACDVMKDADGNAGVVWLDKNGEAIYFVQVQENFDGQDGYRVVEVSKGLRGFIREFLLDSQSGSPFNFTDFSTAWLQVDQSRDALWLGMGERVLVMRRPSLLDGRRGFEPAHYRLIGDGSSVSIKYVAFSPRHRLKWIRSNGNFDEVEWNSTDNEFILGPNRDAGHQMPEAFWRGRKEVGPNRRILNILLDYDNEPPDVEFISSRQTKRYRGTTAKRRRRIGRLQQGWEHSVVFYLNESQGPLHGAVYQETIIGMRLGG